MDFHSYSPAFRNARFQVARTPPRPKPPKRPVMPVTVLKVAPAALEAAKEIAAETGACPCRVKIDREARHVDLVNRCTCEQGKRTRT